MRNLLIALTGFLAGAGLIAGIAIALPGTDGGTVKAASAQPAAARPTAVHMGGGMSGMGSAMMSSAALATRHLTIQHVRRGCHVWSDGKATAVLMRLHLRRGQKLSIMDMDVDAHQMLQFAGPMHLRLGGPMLMNHGRTLSFPMTGIYRLGTKTVGVPGMHMDVKTIGPDNKLRLLVTVA